MISDRDVDEVFSNEFYSMTKKLQIKSGLWPFQSKLGQKARQLIIFLSLNMMLYPLVSH